jgi:hypothetical protein
MPSSWAIAAIGRPVDCASATASALNSDENCRRCCPVGTPSARHSQIGRVSTTRGLATTIPEQDLGGTVSATSQPGTALASSFTSDLLTDWVPDAIGAADVIAGLYRGEVPPPQPVRAAQLLAAMATRCELIPVIDVAARARLHCLTEDALVGYSPDQNVFGYRSLEVDYRAAYHVRQERLRSFARDPRYPLVLAVDVARFSASVPLPVILRQTWMTPVLADEIIALRATTGRCLLPGHHWANRIGSAVLGGVDAALRSAVGRRWIRWADDFHVLLTGSQEADQVRHLLSAELARVGLKLSEEKTRLLPTSALPSGPARDVSGDPAHVWQRGVANTDVRALRYALPRLAARHDPVALGDLLSITAEHSYLIPRAVHYLDRFAESSSGAAIGVELLQRETTPAVIGRLLALAVRHPALLAAVPDHALLAATSADVPALLALVWRTAMAHGKTPPPPTQRIAAWVRDGGQLALHLPSLETLL